MIKINNYISKSISFSRYDSNEFCSYVKSCSGNGESLSSCSSVFCLFRNKSFSGFKNNYYKKGQSTIYKTIIASKIFTKKDREKVIKDILE
jgi:hypothetical protein